MTRTAVSRGKIPLYLQLASALRRKIETGEWRDGDRIPSFEQLAETFDMARVTARQAIATLESEGLVKRYQGRGTFVTRSGDGHRWFSVQTSWQSLVQMIEGTSLRRLATDSHVACPLAVPSDGDPAPDYRYMRRVHSKDGRPYALIDLYLAEEVYALAPGRFDEATVLSVFDELPIGISAAWQTLTVDSAGSEVAEILDIPFNAPIVNVRRVVRDDRGRLIYLGSVVYRGDFLRLDINLIG